MKILLTGGAGFIGSHLCDRLLSLHNKITVIDNLILGRKENISHLIGNESFTFHEKIYWIWKLYVLFLQKDSLIWFIIGRQF